jgi:hypothetical protein
MWRISRIRAANFTSSSSCAVHEGSISLLRDNIRELLLEAYTTMGAANAALESKSFHTMSGDAWNLATNEAQRRMIEARNKIMAARTELLKFLSNDALS